MADPGAVAAAPFALKDYVTAALACASLAWNYYNFRYTKKLRSETFEADEWKYERSEIKRALRDFEDATHLVVLLTSAQHDRAGLVKELAERGKALTLAHGKLAREVQKSGLTGISIGAVYGYDADGESSWDRINTAIADASELEDVAAMRTKLTIVQGLSSEIARAVQAQLDEKRTQLIGKRKPNAVGELPRIRQL